MKKIQYNIYERDTKNASGKAKKDVSAILMKHGFENLYHPSPHRLIRLAQQFFSIIVLPQDTLLFVQYQANIPFFYRLLNKFKKITKIAIIHDLESLRGFIDTRKEAEILQGFDIIISHNKNMTKYLQEIGVKNKIYELEIFDYLLAPDTSISDNYNRNEIFFAGNLQKSSFLNKISRLSNVVFNLYGAPFEGIETLKQIDNVNYKGSFSAEKLIPNIAGGWGLVWDGDSLSTCSGTVGEYMKYNCPHKVSMCIVCERPVIIWKEAAMSDYIISNELGIAVSSLKELPEAIAKVDDADYERMRTNVIKEKARISQGKSLGEILSKL